MENQAGFQEQTSSVEELVNSAQAYGKTSLELLQLEATQKASAVISSMIVGVSVLMPILICLIILNIGLSFWIGELLGKVYYGFFTVAGFYFITGLILYIGRRKLIEKPVIKMVITQILK